MSVWLTPNGAGLRSGHSGNSRLTSRGIATPIGHFPFIESHTIIGGTIITLADQIRTFVWSIPRLGRICGLIAFIGLGLLLLSNVFFSSGADGGVDPWIAGGLFCFLLWPLAVVFPWDVVRSITETNS